jgi:glycyl-tRNA synthetase beta chain
VHWVVQLFGNEVVAGQFFGVAAGKQSRGHRFHADKSIEIDSPANYAALLESEGHIIPQFDRRREMIRELVIAEGVKANATSVIDEALLTEVASLVEFPVALTGKFEAHYLEVPAEALILAMKSHQKTFYCVDDEGKLLPLFIAVSNIVSKDPAQVIEGNERVIRPRLADASFFFETDKQVSLESHLEELKKIVFQDKLGTVYDRSVRIAKLSRALAPLCGAEPELCERAAMLSKCDLMTNMVSEFADLQGLMGRYYALNDGEPREVADAIDEQYRPRFAGDELPTGVTGAVLALSEKLDTLCGLFAIGQPPTGSKDPFALRRAAIGLLRILIEKELDLDLTICIDLAFRGLTDLDPSSVDCSDKTQQQALAFLLDRLQAWSADKGISAEVFQSVMALKPTRPVDFDRRVQAVAHFQSLDESAALAAANKRVSNLLAKQSVDADAQVNAELFAEPAEKALFDKLVLVESEVDPLFARGDYKQGLAALAQLRQTVDTFFDDVLVVSDEEALRNNRLALLSRLRRGFLRSADISYLSS